MLIQMKRYAILVIIISLALLAITRIVVADAASFVPTGEPLDCTDGRTAKTGEIQASMITTFTNQAGFYICPIRFGNSSVNTLLGNYVWNDVNLDGKQQILEAGLANIEVRCVCDTAAPAGATTYDLHIEVVKPPSTVFTEYHNGNPALDSDIIPGGLSTPSFQITSGQNNMTWDAGIIFTAPVNIALSNQQTELPSQAPLLITTLSILFTLSGLIYFRNHKKRID